MNDKPKIKRHTKLGRILESFANGRSLNRFQAVELHDWCLNTTVSAIQQYGVRVDRKIETVRGYLGTKTHCARYWLDAEQRSKARKLLNL